MNERIRELALKAKLGSAEFDNGIRYYVSTEESFEQFAQLIVRECMRLNSKELSITAIERLLPLYKVHFGV